MNQRAADRLANILAPVLLAAIMLLGGGGSPSPLSETLLECFAALVAMVLIVTFPNDRRFGRSSLIAAALILALPVMQMIPLPPLIWQAMPGHQAERAALTLIERADSWRSWSVLPDRTLASLLAMVPPVILMLLAASQSYRWQRRMIALIAAISILSLLVGAAQLAGGTGSLWRFYVTDQDYLLGFQANHNSSADILLLAMVAIAAIAESKSIDSNQPPGAPLLLLAVTGASALLILGTVLTASRAGMALIPIAILAQLAILRRHFRFGGKQFALTALGVAAVVGVSWFLLRDNHVIVRILRRFDFAGEFRPEIWKDAVFVLRQYWPFGSGMGTFMPVFMAAERLEVLDPAIANRAHNDFLELAIEGGIPAIALMIAIAALILRAAMRGLLSAPLSTRPLLVFALATMLILGLHSLVDYPLRSMALAGIMAFASGLLLAPMVNGPAASSKTARIEA